MTFLPHLYIYKQIATDVVHWDWCGCDVISGIINRFSSDNHEIYWSSVQMICNVNMVVHAYVHLFASVFFYIETHVVPEYSKNHVSSGFRGVYISQVKAKYIAIIWYVYDPRLSCWSLNLSI